MYVAVDGDCALLACRDGVDGKLRAGDDVAAGEHVGNAGLIAGQRHLDLALCAGGDALHAAEVDLLADGGDDGGDIKRLELAGTDGLSVLELHDLDLELLCLALAAYLCGSGQEHELHALFDGLFDLIVGSGHSVAVTAVYDRGLRAEADGSTCNVDGDIAAADDGDVLADCGLLAEVYLAQEVDAGEHAGQLVARAADLCALGRADSEIEGLEALLAQLIERYILADLNAGLEFDAQILEHIDLGINNVLFKAE